MSARPAILKHLTDSRNLAVERIIELAIADSPPPEQKELATILLERNRRPGWVILIRVFDRLDEEIQEMVLSHPRDLFGALAETMSDSEGPARENIIRIVQRCADGKLVHLLAEALIDSRPEVRELAGNALLEAIRKSRDTNDTWEPALDNSAQVQRAIQFSLRQYRTHRQQSALLAALVFERQQDAPLWTYFQDACDDLTRAAAALLRAIPDPGVIPAAILGLNSPLRSAALTGVASIDDAPIADALARESYRLLDPLLRESAKGVGHIKTLSPQRKDFPWNAETWPGWLRLIEIIGFQPSHKLTLLTHMLRSIPAGDEGAVWKLSVMRALVETNLPDAGRLLAPLIADADERVARCAARYLVSKSRSEWHGIAALVLPKSPYPGLRRLATGLRAAHSDPSFDKVWGDYQKMPPVIQHTKTRVGVSDPGFAEQLRTKLTSVQPSEISQGLKMLSALPNLVPYRGQIITLCGHPDPRITAIAIQLVGRLEDPKLKDLLEAAAKHVDPRVRANAVDSMSALHIADRSQQMLTLLNSRHNRERANAIKAMSEFDYYTARDCLERMLVDANPVHRMSALWVVSQMHMLDVIRRVSSIARRDPNMRVRRHAAEMLESLTASTNAPV